MSEQTDKEPEGFSQEWLSLREPADHAARSPVLTRHINQWIQSRSADQLKVMDLGAGTGSNLRYLCPGFGHNQHWTLIDNDASLLSNLPTILTDWAAGMGMQIRQDHHSIHLQTDTFSSTIEWHINNLADDMAQLPFSTTDLTTGSALLDLTSTLWLDELAMLCNRYECASLFVLNYDGRIHWQPELHEDERIQTLLNAHQLTDKGFGPALGPAAGEYFSNIVKLNQKVMTEGSDWTIDKSQQALQQALIEGWAGAATEQDPAASQAAHQWRQQRTLVNQQREATLTVGHIDVLALPSGHV